MTQRKDNTIYTVKIAKQLLELDCVTLKCGKWIHPGVQFTINYQACNDAGLLLNVTIDDQTSGFICVKSFDELEKVGM